MANIEETQTCVSLYRVVEHIVGDTDCSDADQWDCALKGLIASVSDGKLKVSGFRTGSEIWETIPFKEFAEIADNPYGDIQLDVEYSGKRVLEFNSDLRAKILRSHFNGAPTVLWTNVCANSGTEILSLWPSPTLEAILRKAIHQNGGDLTQDQAEKVAPGWGQTKIRDTLAAILGRKNRGPRPGSKRGAKIIPLEAEYSEAAEKSCCVSNNEKTD
jgi:hypothetical protein